MSKKQKKIITTKSSSLEKDLSLFEQHLNHFLQNQFTLNLQTTFIITNYITAIRNLFIDLATTQINPILNSIASKIGNIFQPLTKNNMHDYASQQYQAQQTIHKLQRKVKKLKQQLEENRVKNQKLMKLVYTLRMHSIDVDTIYRENCEEEQQQIRLSGNKRKLEQSRRHDKQEQQESNSFAQHTVSKAQQLNAFFSNN